MDSTPTWHLNVLWQVIDLHLPLHTQERELRPGWMTKASVLVIAITLSQSHGDHMVGILPREGRWCILCVDESYDRGTNICKALRDGPFVS